MLEKLFTEDIQEVNEREKYWIKKLESHCSTGKGYNASWGGDSREHARTWSQEEIANMKQLIKEKTPFIDIAAKYGASASFISSLNHGIYYFDETESYPLCKYYKEDKDYDELIDLLLNSTYSLARIAEMLEMGYSTVKKINAGTLRKGLYPIYPIRKISANEQRANKIKELLLTTNFSNREIAQMVSASEETVRRIKVGESYYNEKLSYPLKTCNDYSE